MTCLYLLYGASFFAAGVLLGFQARLSSSVLPRTAKIPALAPSSVGLVWLRLGAIGLGMVSFVMLAQFGVVVLRVHQRWPRWSLALPGLIQRPRTTEFGRALKGGGP